MGLPQIRADWAQHMVYGAWVGAVGAAGVLALGQVAGRPGLGLLAPVVSLLAALLAGVAKEVADHVANRRAAIAPPYEVSAADMVATLIGVLPVVLFFLVVVEVMEVQVR